MQLISWVLSGLPVVTSTAPSPPTSSKSFCTVSLTGGDKRNARTEQCEGSERTPQTVTSTLHQINLFYWFPRSPLLCQVTVPRNVPACPGSGAETILTVAGSAVPGGISGCSSCRERENPNLRPCDPPAKTDGAPAPAQSARGGGGGLRQGWGRPRAGERRAGEESGSSAGYAPPGAPLQPTFLFQHAERSRHFQKSHSVTHHVEGSED